MNQNDERTISKIRKGRNKLEYININGNGKAFIQVPDNPKINLKESQHYSRSYLRFRKSSSRSRSRNPSKFYHIRSSINHRKKLILLILQIVALLHLCSIIYFHKKQPLFSTKYTIITLVLLNILTYFCVRYDTQQAEHGELLLGENLLLFLFWYGGILGGNLALLIEKHKHLRSQAFTFRLRILILFNCTWLFIFYALYMYHNEFLYSEASGAFFSFFLKPFTTRYNG